MSWRLAFSSVCAVEDLEWAERSRFPSRKLRTISPWPPAADRAKVSASVPRKPVPQYADRNPQLSGVPLHVLGRVEEQTQHRRGQPLSSHRPGVRQGLLVRRSQLLQGAFHLLMKGLHQLLDTSARSWRLPLGGQVLLLFPGQRLPSGVREEAIDHTPEVL
jgi:hypothetical protein